MGETYAFAEELKNQNKDKDATYTSLLEKAKEIQDNMQKVAVEHEELMLAKAKTAQMIAEDSRDELMEQVEIANKCSPESIKEMEDALKDAQTQVQSGSDRAKEAAKHAADLADTSATAAIKAGTFLFHEAHDLVCMVCPICSFWRRLHGNPFPVKLIPKIW